MSIELSKEIHQEMHHFKELDELAKFGSWANLTKKEMLEKNSNIKKNVAAIGSVKNKKAIILVSKEAYPSHALAAVVNVLRANEFNIERHFANREIIEMINEVDEESTRNIATEEDGRNFNALISSALKSRASDIFLNRATVNGYKASFDVDTRIVPHQDYTARQIAGMMRYFYQKVADSHSHPTFSSDESQFASGEGTFDGSRLRLRFQSKPEFRHGNDYAIRLLLMSEEGGFGSYEDLGLPESQTKLLAIAARKESGAVVMAGPTGSGKTTTIKVMLERAFSDNPSLVVRTCEKPPEYLIKGARQYSASEDYASDIKDLMRMSPTLLFIGEISDPSTAGLFRQATETGHGVLTTIHTIDTFSIADRLEGYEIDREIFAHDGNINALIFQKRVPVTCKHCRIRLLDNSDQYGELISRLKLLKEDLSNVYVHNKTGCSSCNHDGVDGARVTMEVVIPDSHVLRAIREKNKQAYSAAWVKRCKESGFGDAAETHFYHSLRLMLEGELCPLILEEKYGTIDLANLRDNTRTFSSEGGFDV